MKFWIMLLIGYLFSNVSIAVTSVKSRMLLSDTNDTIEYTSFNSKGQIIEEKFWIKMGVGINTIKSNYYDDKGNNIKKEVYIEKEKIRFISELNYDQFNNISNVISYIKNDSTQDTLSLLYKNILNNKNEVLESIVLNTKSFDTLFYNKYEYDKNGNIKSYINFSVQNNTKTIQRIEQKEYDIKGNVISYIEKRPLEKYKFESNKELNPSGLIIKETQFINDSLIKIINYYYNDTLLVTVQTKEIKKNHEKIDVAKYVYEYW